MKRQVSALMHDRSIDEIIDRLLAGVDPASSSPVEFLGAQFDAGLAWVQHPAGLGGLGLRAGLQRRVDDRLTAAGAKRPILRNPIGVGMGAPTVVAHGTPDQHQRYLRALFTCEELWCQLFSEPGAGSDLAGLATRAVRDGDGWVVTGQKVWTSLAHLARRGLLLARTDPDQSKHRGLTYFVVDMTTPGVTVRPLRQMTGSSEFNEVFLDGVRVPDSDRLGAVGDGWRVAATTLSNERVALSGAGSGASNIGGSTIDALMRLAGEQDAWSDLGARDRIVQLYLESRVIRLTNQRARAARRRSAPGPEGSVTKLFQGLHNRRLQECLLELAGVDAAVWDPGDERAAGRATGFLRAQANTIEGGTSNVSRNIIGERVLGLPREPGLPRDLPWKDIPRS